MSTHPEELGPGFKIIKGPNLYAAAIGVIEKPPAISDIPTEKLHNKYTLEPSKTLVTTKAFGGDLGYKVLNSRREKLRKFVSGLRRK